jgi:hypothetical protein
MASSEAHEESPVTCNLKPIPNIKGAIKLTSLGGPKFNF